MTRKKLYERAIEEFGEQAQINQAIEECAELIVALNHYRRANTVINKSAIREESAVREEIADVLIMCAQLSLIFGQHKVEEEKEIKLLKLEKHLEAQR